MLLKVFYYYIANFLIYEDKNIVQKQQLNYIIIVVLANLLILF